MSVNYQTLYSTVNLLVKRRRFVKGKQEVKSGMRSQRNLSFLDAIARYVQYECNLNRQWLAI